MLQGSATGEDEEAVTRKQQRKGQPEGGPISQRACGCKHFFYAKAAYVSASCRKDISALGVLPSGIYPVHCSAGDFNNVWYVQLPVLVTFMLTAVFTKEYTALQFGLCP